MVVMTNLCYAVLGVLLTGSFVIDVVVVLVAVVVVAVLCVFLSV